jgi:hypothetical protein
MSVAGMIGKASSVFSPILCSALDEDEENDEEDVSEDELEASVSVEDVSSVE